MHLYSILDKGSFAAALSISEQALHWRRDQESPEQFIYQAAFAERYGKKTRQVSGGASLRWYYWQVVLYENYQAGVMDLAACRAYREEMLKPANMLARLSPVNATAELEEACHA